MQFKKKDRLGVFITLVVIVVIIGSLFVDVDAYIPNFSKYILLLWPCLLLVDIYKAIAYKRNKPKYEMRIRSSNDSYYAVLPFVFGVLYCFFSILILAL